MTAHRDTKHFNSTENSEEPKIVFMNSDKRNFCGSQQLKEQSCEPSFAVLEILPVVSAETALLVQIIKDARGKK
jgi:hypothetical protein